MASEHDKLKRALRQSEQRLSALISKAPVTMFMLNKQGAITLLMGREYIGEGNLSFDQVLNISVFDLLSSSLPRDQIEAIFQRVIGGEEVTITVEFNQMWFNTSMSPFRDETDAIVGVVGVATDVTQRVHAERESQRYLAELQETHARLSEVEQLKTDMIRVAAHDLRGMLGIILGYLEIMQTDMTPDTRSQFQMHFEAINRSVQRVQRLANDILSLDRFESSAVVIEPLDVGEIVQRACVDHRLPAQQKAIALSINLPDAPLLVKGDQSQLYAAVANLISNAIKYTLDGGQVAIRLSQSDDTAVFEVEDTGVGIPADKQDRLFQPFYRVNLPETRDVDSTGLGLYLVRTIVRRHGGQMRFHSVYGQGSTFGFELPLLSS